MYKQKSLQLTCDEYSQVQKQLIQHRKNQLPQLHPQEAIVSVYKKNQFSYENENSQQRESLKSTRYTID